MKYLIVQDWLSTHSNYASMKHMCNLLVVKYPNEYKMFVKESPQTWNSPKKIMNKPFSCCNKWFKGNCQICGFVAKIWSKKQNSQQKEQSRVYIRKHHRLECCKQKNRTTATGIIQFHQEKI